MIKALSISIRITQKVDYLKNRYISNVPFLPLLKQKENGTEKVLETKT